ncbi:sensor histidine kinase, partial [uncultured Chitinophaga sp.]|uniref:sensor histidine kinase n=1 Tax=uncultured Chitinophaga sp. TaxID=339340 RepID=UPI0025FFB3F5
DLLDSIIVLGGDSGGHTPWEKYQVAQAHFRKGEIAEAERVLLSIDAVYMSTDQLKKHELFDLLHNIYKLKGDGAKAMLYAGAALQSLQAQGIPAAQILVYLKKILYISDQFGSFEKYEDLMQKVRDEVQPDNLTDWTEIINYAHELSFRRSKMAAINYLKERFISVPITLRTRLMEYHEYMGAFYCNLNDSIALIHLNETEKLLQRISYREANLLQATNFLQIATIYYRQGHYDKIGPYLKKVDALPQKSLGLHVLTNKEWLHYKIDSIRGDYPGALSHYSVYRSYSDSLFNFEKIVRLEEFNVFSRANERQKKVLQKTEEVTRLAESGRLRQALLEEMEESERQSFLLLEREVEDARSYAKQRGDSLRRKQETILLLGKEAGLQKMLVTRVNAFRNLLGIGAALLILLVMLTYSRYRLKQRSNRQLEHQQAIISLKNASLEKLVDEKEWLLKEVHHRVKNNLQVVMSLLNIQSYYLHDEKAKSAMLDSQHRVNAISLIHKKLYQSENPSVVVMPHYIKELTEQLYDYSDKRLYIQFDLDIAPLTFDINKALPIGLILNESVTNCFKYAFRGRDEGLITIRMRQKGKHAVVLEIADNGVGMPASAQPPTDDSLGMSLMKGLASDMDGSLVISSEEGKGTLVTVIFNPGDAAELMHN